MRVIGGELRGRRLVAPEGDRTRPMLDRVREALFSTLVPWLEGAVVLDLFAGSGSLGIEALSRGARRARFVERAPQALSCLRANLEELALAGQADVIPGDALVAATWGEEPADVVFLDPPYPLLKEKKAHDALFAAIGTLSEERLAHQGVLVFHAPRRAVFRSEFDRELVVREREYGSNSLWFVQREAEEDGGEGA